MAIIRVDFDEIMQFGRTYIVTSESLVTHSRTLNLPSAKLDRVAVAFGIDLATTSNNFRGKNIAASAADAEARAGRVSDYLNHTGISLYQHAGSVGYQDDHFDWLGGIFSTFTGPIGETLEFLGGSVLGEFPGAAAKVFGVTGFATAGVVLGSVVGIVLGGATMIDKGHDLLFDDGGLWEQIADGLGFVAGAGALIVGGFTIAAMVVLGVTAGAYVLAAAIPIIVVSALAGFASYAIDNREAIGAALTSAWDGITDFAGDVWDFGTDIFDDARDFADRLIPWGEEPQASEQAPDAPLRDIMITSLGVTRRAFEEMHRQRALDQAQQLQIQLEETAILDQDEILLAPYDDRVEATRRQFSDGTYGMVDQWGFAEHNCTSWVAYRINERNFGGQDSFTNQYQTDRWGNAYEWGPKAKELGLWADQPSVGDVAWYDKTDTNKYGHVAYIERVNYAADGSVVSIDISEMNYGTDNPQGRHVETTIQEGDPRWPDGFIHIKDVQPASVASIGTGEAGSEATEVAMTASSQFVSGWQHTESLPGLSAA